MVTWMRSPLRKTRSFADAFSEARATVAAREKSQGNTPSNPQMHLGAAMTAKLEALERRLDSADPGRAAVHAGLRSGSNR